MKRSFLELLQEALSGHAPMPWLYFAEVRPCYRRREALPCHIDFLCKITDRFNCFIPYRNGEFEQSLLERNGLVYELSAIPFNGGLSILSLEDALRIILTTGFGFAPEGRSQPWFTERLPEFFGESLFTIIPEMEGQPVPKLAYGDQGIPWDCFSDDWEQHLLGPFTKVTLKQPFGVSPMEPRYYFEMPFSSRRIVVGARSRTIYTE